VQLVSPGSCVYLPDGQSKHAVDSVTAFEYFPAPHVVQSFGVEGDGAAFPIGHAVHPVDTAVEYLPSGQGEQEVDAVLEVEKVPAGQSAHDVGVEGEDAYVP